MRDNAFKWLTANYIADYAPANGEEPIPVDNKEPAPKVRKLAGDFFLDDDEDEKMEEEVPHIGKNEVEEYLLLSHIPFRRLLTF